MPVSLIWDEYAWGYCYWDKKPEQCIKSVEPINIRFYPSFYIAMPFAILFFFFVYKPFWSV